ncbi:MAG: CPBP family intramembrane metalloprotease [Clostridia bacterium]|nr:CPBP family intramembrane metalloprotease [Clostridia bacterium]
MKSKVFKVYSIYFVSMALFCVMRIASSLGFFSFAHVDVVDIVYTCLIQIGLMLVLPFMLYTAFVKDKPGVFGALKSAKLNQKICVKAILVSFGIGILAFFINIAVSTLFSGLLNFFGYTQPVTNATPAAEPYVPMFSVGVEFAIQVLLVAVLPAFCEEFLHRGLLLNGTRQIGVRKAIFITSLLFGLIHFNINQFFYAFVLGLLMGLVCVVTDSIYPSIIIHFTNNAISVYLTYAELHGWAGANFYNYLNAFLQSTNAILTFIACFAFLSLIVVLLVLFIAKLYKYKHLDGVKRKIDRAYSGGNISNSPISAGSNKMIVDDMVESNTLLNLNYEEMKSPLDIVLPREQNVFKPKLEDNMFLISSLVLGGLITIFTFIWGIL